MRPAPPESAKVRVANGSSADAAYRELKSRLLAGDVPLGVRLGEERVAEQLSVSRTPVREALLRLYAEGFLERHPDGGFRVKHPTTRPVGELYDVRKALELYAVRLTLETLDVVRGSSSSSSVTTGRRSSARRPTPTPSSFSSTRTSTCASPRRPATPSSSGSCAASTSASGRCAPMISCSPPASGRRPRSISRSSRRSSPGPFRRATLLQAHICESQRVVEELVGRVLERMVGLGAQTR